MIKEEQITKLIDAHLDGTEMFLVKLNVSKGNLINIFIDGDQGVTIDDCVQLSRHIESSLDRDTDDFELRVSSTGAEEPFVNHRQYLKNIGRSVKIHLNDGNIKKGILESANDNSVVIKEEVKRKNKKSKKMQTGEAISIAIEDIEEAHVLVIF